MRKTLKKLLAGCLAAALMAATLTVTGGASMEVEAAGSLSGSTASSATMALSAADAYQVSAYSALISGSNVVVETLTTTAQTSDDGLYHLMASAVNEADTEGTEVATAQAASSGASTTFTFALNNNTATSRLYDKFTVVVYQNGSKVQVSNPVYIQNPETLATHTSARLTSGKKGLLPESTLLHSGTLAAAGIDQITYNVPIGNILSGTGITYTYNGKTYTFSSAAVGQLDDLVPLMNSQGIAVTLIILNNWASGYSTNIHPLSRDSYSQNYYAFNTVDDAGVEQLEALASFLGQRYSGTGYGTVDNWIIGNEINAWSPWHYMSSSVDINYFTAEYAKAFRIFYNGIKSQNANAKVYTCVDQEYAEADSSLHYAGQTWLTLFNQMISATGNIGWDVAVHPYDYPLYDTYPWLQTVTYPTKVNHTQASAYVTMANIDVFTDFMCSEAMLAPDGSVRSIICSEQGYVSSNGELIQAAAVVYGYLQAVNNQYIDAFILSREMDHATELAQGLAMGLRDTSGTAKTALSWYSTAETEQTQAAASAVIGTSITSLLTYR